METETETHCQDKAGGRRERVGSPSLCSLDQGLPISPDETYRRLRHTGLFVCGGSRLEILRLLRGVRAVEHRRLDRRHGAAMWFFGLCGRLWGRMGRVGELERCLGFGQWDGQATGKMLRTLVQYTFEI